jgi:hypothetical protein
MNQPALASGRCPLVLALQADGRPGGQGVEPHLPRMGTVGAAKAGRSATDCAEPDRRIMETGGPALG